MAFLLPVLAFLGQNAAAIGAITSIAGTAANIGMSAGGKKGGGTVIQQAASTPADEDLETKRKRVLAMQKQMGRGSTLLTSSSDYAPPASTVGGSLRSTLGGG